MRNKSWIALLAQIIFCFENGSTAGFPGKQNTIWSFKILFIHLLGGTVSTLEMRHICNYFFQPWKYAGQLPEKMRHLGSQPGANTAASPRILCILSSWTTNIILNLSHPQPASYPWPKPSVTHQHIWNQVHIFHLVFRVLHNILDQYNFSGVSILYTLVKPINLLFPLKIVLYFLTFTHLFHLVGILSISIFQNSVIFKMTPKYQILY